jgi:hypothetical protein
LKKNNKFFSLNEEIAKMNKEHFEEDINAISTYLDKYNV